jgi:hypothetical protein
MPSGGGNGTAWNFVTASATARRTASLTCNIMLHGEGPADRDDPWMYAVLGLGVVIGVIWAVRRTLDRLRMYG